MPTYGRYAALVSCTASKRAFEIDPALCAEPARHHYPRQDGRASEGVRRAGGGAQHRMCERRLNVSGSLQTARAAPIGPSKLMRETGLEPARHCSR